MKTICSLSAAVLLLVAFVAASGSDKKQPVSQSNIKFLVLKDDNGKPVRNAAIVLHPVAQTGKQERGGFELKADHDGKAETEGIPYGPLRIQVIADGFQTFGQDYTISQPETNIEIRLKRPKEQYSVYGDHSGATNPDSNNPPK